MENVDCDDNTYEIAKMIFQNPPKEPHSIQLQLDDITRDFAEQDGEAYFISYLLRKITMYGIVILFNKPLELLDSSDIDLLQRYTNSYGYKFEYSIDDGFLKYWFTELEF